jgi:uncharacterized protein (DUF1810 family)
MAFIIPTLAPRPHHPSSRRHAVYRRKDGTAYCADHPSGSRLVVRRRELPSGR